jgi:hypothetical protein
MKGFIPVTKTALQAMIDNCREEIVKQAVKHHSEQIDRFIAYEKERMTTRHWYRLFILPKARFDFNEESIMAHAANQDYAMFDCNPFVSLVRDAANSNRWLDKLERLAMSEYAGEPIQIDINTFSRINEPDSYYWATSGSLYSVRYTR